VTSLIDISRFKKILVIDFGQVGDVVMSFPALKAIRERFGNSEIVVLAGKTPGRLVRDLKFADRVIAVDRVALLRGKKLGSIGRIISLARDIRREKFDLVIDLHSLYETNLLGFLSGARHRLFADRENRSLNLLSNFRPKPPKEDKKLHLADHYLNMLQPLGIESNGRRSVKVELELELVENVRRRVFSEIDFSKELIGIAPGAGNPSRRWPLENFAELSHGLAAGGRHISVFLGPEEEPDIEKIYETFASGTQIVPGLTLSELAAAFSQIDLLISNDSGPAHIAAVVGVPIVLVSDKRAPMTYTPLSEKIELVRTDEIESISVEDVRAATEKLSKSTFTASADQGR